MITDEMLNGDSHEDFAPLLQDDERLKAWESMCKAVQPFIPTDHDLEVIREVQAETVLDDDMDEGDYEIQELEDRTDAWLEGFEHQRDSYAERSSI